MNRINPIYLIIILILLLTIVIYKCNSLDKYIYNKEKYVFHLEESAKELSTLRKYWGDKELQKKRINSLIQSTFIKKFIKTIEKNRDGVKIYFENINGKEGDFLLNKILNSFVKIDKLKILKSDKKASVEIGFRY